MDRRITIKDIARESGVHYSTVSRALRDDPMVAAATRELIAETARRLGYSPDPMLRALALYRSSLQPVPSKETIAFLWPEQTRSEIVRSVYLQRYLRGARTRATELGFELSEFFVRDHKPAALERILHARGIRGLIVGVFNHAREARLDFPLENFACAALGGALQTPALHRVSHDHYHAMRTALRATHALGYRKIGFVVSDFLDEILEARYSMSFLAHHPLGAAKAAKLLRVAPFTDQALADFIASTAPEAIITTFSFALESPALRLPDGSRMPLVSLDVLPGKNTHAGIDQVTEFNAANAVDLVAEQVLHGRGGLPAVQKKVLSDGIWCEGPSCPAK